MNSSNSFNICPRCGNSNSLNAKYCSRCGAQLKVPTEAVVCHKCHTRNSSLANFCRNCGATLKVGAQTKICPRCGREIGAEENICACGYSFVSMQQTEPKRADVSSTNKDKKKDKKRDRNNTVEPTYTDTTTSVKEKPAKRKKGGRGFAIFALILIAVFAYAILAQVTLRGPLGDFDKGYFYMELASYVEGMEITDKDMLVITTTKEIEGENVEVKMVVQSFSGYSMLKSAFELLFNKETKLDENMSMDDLEKLEMTFFDLYKLANIDSDNSTSKFDFFKQVYGWGGVIILGMITLFLVTSLLHVLSCILRLVSPRRSKRGNWLYLTLTILTAIIAALIIFSPMLADKEGFLNTIYKFIAPGVTAGETFTAYSVGYATAYIPAAYFVLFLYSCIAKKKMPKKEKKDKKSK